MNAASDTKRLTFDGRVLFLGSSAEIIRLIMAWMAVAEQTPPPVVCAEYVRRSFGW